MNCRLLLAVAVAVATFGVRTAPAQVFMLEPTTQGSAGVWVFDVGGQMAQPIGAFSTQIDRAWGVGASVRYHFRWFSALGVRGDVAWLNYGSENKRVPLSPTLNRVLVDMHTMNNIAMVSGGPELMVPRGPVRPYVYAFAGYSYFYTESSASDDSYYRDNIASTTNFDDGGLATGWGGGVRVPMVFRRVEAAFDAGARLTRNGTRTYLRRGDILDQPDGSLLFNQRTTLADFWQYHLGVSFSPRHR